MNPILLLFDVGPPGSVIGAVFGVGFFLLLAGMALVAYLALRKTLKWGIRIAIAGIILLIAIGGCITFWWYGSQSDENRRRQRPPAPTRPQR